MKYKLAFLVMIVITMVIISGCGLTPGKTIAGEASRRGEAKILKESSNNYEQTKVMDSAEQQVSEETQIRNIRGSSKSGSKKQTKGELNAACTSHSECDTTAKMYCDIYPKATAPKKNHCLGWYNFACKSDSDCLSQFACKTGTCAPSIGTNCVDSDKGKDYKTKAVMTQDPVINNAGKKFTDVCAASILIQLGTLDPVYWTLDGKPIQWWDITAAKYNNGDDESNDLIEGACDENGVPTLEIVSCSEVLQDQMAYCKNGACIVPAQQKKFTNCVDSDNGKDYKTKAVMTQNPVINNAGKEFNDVCAASILIDTGQFDPISWMLDGKPASWWEITASKWSWDGNDESNDLIEGACNENGVPTLEIVTCSVVLQDEMAYCKNGACVLPGKN